MSGKRAIYAAGVAKAIAPYTPAVLVGNTLYISGQIAVGADGKIPASAAEQTIGALERIKVRDAARQRARLTLAWRRLSLRRRA